MIKALKRICYILTLPCSEATRLASAGLEGPLQWHERFALSAHRICCGSCRHFKHQLAFLLRTGRLADENSTAKLSEEAKMRLKQAVLKYASQDPD